MIPRLVLIKGAGDLATGIAHRLWNSGFDLVMLELPEPLVIRRTVSFATAVMENSIEVEAVKAELCRSSDQVKRYHSKGIIPVIVDPRAKSIKSLNPAVIIDAIMAKKNLGTAINDADLVIGIGPGFTAGEDVNAVVETKRGHSLGKVLYSGTTIPNTATPGEINGYGVERLVRAPVDGIFKPLKEIGDLVDKHEPVAMVGNIEICAATGGLVRGMLYPGIIVKAGIKVGDIDPRGPAIDWLTISDKARAIGGGVLEAIMHHYNFSN